MLFPKDNQKPNEPGAQPQSGMQMPQGMPMPQASPPQQPIIVQTTGGGGGGVKIPILFGAVVALIGACVYLFYQLNQVRNDLAQTRDTLSTELSKIYETTTVTAQTNRHNQERLEKDLQAQLDRAHAQAAQLSGQAKQEAEQHAEQIAAKLQQAQDAQAKQIATVSTDLSQTKSETAAKIDGVSSDVGTVRTDVSKNRADTEKLIAGLKTAQGDLGMQSGLIATNGKELAALKELGERNYSEFKIAKTKKPQKVGEVQILLKSADPKHNRYTIELIADDKLTEKKDRSLNEPVQFMLSRARPPYELVVNDIKKDLIVGYLAAPKVQQSRN